ncbi:hypothetical protein BKA65DRAFT_120534 [Rhexocercosporidium sp. MPI-PUGE-AT-0058]|nr:hypothetical protein BKA65DRAFT_120534 [Rhexocercosporidium sp. MPI-PUGE-AT-0058]
MPPPKIQTYHCLCLSLLLSSTHTLSSLPRRTSPSPDDTDPLSSDRAIILPLPSTPPRQEARHEEGEEVGGVGEESLPTEGYTILSNLQADRKTTIVRRDDGFEKRVLYRCARCRLVVGYELLRHRGGDKDMTGTSTDMDRDMDMDIDCSSASGKGTGKGTSKGKGKATDEAYDGKILYILPGGLMSTDVLGSGRRIREEDVGFSNGVGGGAGVAVFE